MKWLLIAALLLAGCTIEVKPIPRKKPEHHIFHHHHVKPSPSATTGPTPDPLSKLAPLIREKSED